MSDFEEMLRSFTPPPAQTREYQQWVDSCPLSEYNGIKLWIHFITTVEEIGTTEDDSEDSNPAIWAWVVQEIDRYGDTAAAALQPIDSLPSSSPYRAFISLYPGESGMKAHFPIDGIIPQVGDLVDFQVVYSNENEISIELRRRPTVPESDLSRVEKVNFRSGYV